MAGWEVEQLEGLGDSACGCVVVEIELALMLWVPIDALVRSQMVVRGRSTVTFISPLFDLEVPEHAKC